MQSTSCTPRVCLMIAAMAAQVAPPSAPAMSASGMTTMPGHAAACSATHDAIKPPTAICPSAPDINDTGTEAKSDTNSGKNVRGALIESEGNSIRRSQRAL